MSRSRPSDHAPNPAKRWFEWQGEKGVIRYYDKVAKKNVDLGDDFTFLLLDQLASVGGWHDASDSGIYSNLVKDTTADVLVVKSFKGGILAEGHYKRIKDTCAAAGGHYVANLFIAYKEDGELAIGVLRLKGVALRAWMEFTSAHRGALYTDGIRIHGSEEGIKGRVVYKTPKFGTLPASQATADIAAGLDTELQEWLDAYLARTKTEQVATAEPDSEPGEEPASPPPLGTPYMRTPAPIDDDPVPF